MMASKSSIEWTGHTWNPIAGCSVLSPGCTNCYAMKVAARLGRIGQHLYKDITQQSKAGAVWTGEMRKAARHVLLDPLHRKKPTTYFVNSMSDLFHENVPDEWIDEIFAVMALCPQHTFQVLTKRAARMQQWFDGDRADRVGLAMLTIVDRIPHGHRRVPWPLVNVWLGVSTERQQEADERIPPLLRTPAAVRFISAEPLLGPINLTSINHQGVVGGHSALHDRGLGQLDWVICGGESGYNARPMHPDWARALRDQCAAADVPFFFKQWGNWKPLDQFETQVVKSAGVHGVIRNDGRFIVDTDIADPPRAVFTFKMSKHDAGRHLDGDLHDAMPINSSA